MATVREELKAIVKSRGAAGEYSKYSLNFYRGCPHGCLYCFGPSITQQSKEEFHANKALVKKASPENIIYDLEYHPEIKTIHACFICDPYPAGWASSPTRTRLQTIKEAGRNIQILTKNPMDAMRDFDLYDLGDSFGVTLTFLDPKKSKQWEPGAALPEYRITVLKAAKESGIKTWASCEPVIEPDETLVVIEAAAPYLDFVWWGKLNTEGKNLPDYIIDIERQIDWSKFKSDAIALSKRLGLAYDIKHDLELAARGRQKGQMDAIVPEVA